MTLSPYVFDFHYQNTRQSIYIYATSIIDAQRRYDAFVKSGEYVGKITHLVPRGGLKLPHGVTFLLGALCMLVFG